MASIKQVAQLLNKVKSSEGGTSHQHIHPHLTKLVNLVQTFPDPLAFTAYLVLREAMEDKASSIEVAQLLVDSQLNSLSWRLLERCSGLKKIKASLVGAIPGAPLNLLQTISPQLTVCQLLQGIELCQCDIDVAVVINRAPVSVANNLTGVEKMLRIIQFCTKRQIEQCSLPEFTFDFIHSTSRTVYVLDPFQESERLLTTRVWWVQSFLLTLRKYLCCGLSVELIGPYFHALVDSLSTEGFPQCCSYEDEQMFLCLKHLDHITSEVGSFHHLETSRVFGRLVLMYDYDPGIFIDVILSSDGSVVCLEYLLKVFKHFREAPNAFKDSLRREQLDIVKLQAMFQQMDDFISTHSDLAQSLRPLTKGIKSSIACLKCT